MSVNVNLLIRMILENSEDVSSLEAAITEWKTWFMFEKCNTQCICGNKITKIFKAVNMLNGTVLEPIGCVCIQRFCEESKLKNTEFYQSFMESQKVHCKDCGINIINESAFKVHMKTKKHIDNIDSWPCLACGKRIKSDNPTWKTRCLKCFKKSKN